MRQIVLPGNQNGKETCMLDAKTSHYLVSVRRMRRGNCFDAMDEMGAHFVCTLLSDDSRETKVALTATADSSGSETSSQTADNEKNLRIALVQAIPKGQNFDLIIRQAVELGVELIIPLISQYCVRVDLEDRSSLKLERRRRIIKEALQQSGSPINTQIETAARFDSLETRLTATGFDRERSIRILFHESAQKPSRTLHELLSGDKNRVVIAIGPEGGFSEDDSAAFAWMGFSIHHAASPVLRVETAATFAISAIRAITTEKNIWKI